MKKFCAALRNSSQMLFFLCMLLILSACGSSRTIVNGLDEKDANEILVFLNNRGLDAAKVKSTETGTGGSKATLWDISVKEDQATEAMSLLNQNGLPRRRGQNLLGLFANVGLVPSEMQDKIRYQAGLAEQIASTIRKIDGVLDADVQLSFPEEDPLHPEENKNKKISASVYVKHSGVLDDPNSHLVTKIKRLVAASVTGLDFDNVTVIGDRARYSELPSGILASALEEEKQYVRVWSLIIAQDSLFRFRVIFFGFTFLILILLLFLIWVVWKVHPLLKDHGGLKGLFSFHGLTPSISEGEPAEKAPEEKKKGSEQKTDKDKGLIDEDIDET